MSTTDLFSQPPMAEGSVERDGTTLRVSGPVEMVLSMMDIAVKKRDTAIILHAAANGPEFGRRSRDFILQYLKDNGPTSGEALVIACKNAGIMPVKDDRAFGGSFLSLSKRGLIVKAGECKRTRGHATAGGIVWKLVKQQQP